MLTLAPEMYVFLVLFTIFAFYYEFFFLGKIAKKKILPEICTFG